MTGKENVGEKKMFKVVFYRVALHQAMIDNYLIYAKARGRRDLNRATKTKLFECYCVNDHQVDVIKKYLMNGLGFDARNGSVFRYSIGHQIIV